MTERQDRVCPVALAGGLDNRFRRWVQDPRRILEPYVREGMTAVDLGCGPGFFTVELARLVGPSGRVIAVDLQAGMLDRVRDRVRGTPLEARVVLHRCEASGIGLTQPVDFGLAFYMLHEIPDQASFFSGVRPLLQAGGRLFVVEPPFHVSRSAFEASLRTAQRAGFTVAARPRVAFSKAALLEPA